MCRGLAETHVRKWAFLAKKSQGEHGGSLSGDAGVRPLGPRWTQMMRGHSSCNGKPPVAFKEKNAIWFGLSKIPLAAV